MNITQMLKSSRSLKKRFVLTLAALFIGISPLAQSAYAVPPVSGYTRWFDASQITGKVNSDPVSTWNDLSGNGADATVPSGNAAPVYVANAGTESGLPAVYFAKNSGANDSAALRFAKAVGIRTIFSVFKGNSFLLTDDSAYDFHRNTDDSPTDPLWAGYASGNIQNGSTYVNGALVNGTAFAMPTSLHNGFNLVEVLTTGNVQADSFNKDRTYHAGNQYHAELIIYDRVLTEAERLSVETYLTDKWMHSAALPPVSGYSRWFDASQITGKTNNEPVSTWNDLSGNGADATVPSGNATPVYVANAGTESGLPAVYFAKNSGANNSAALRFAKDVGIRTVFSVFKGNSFLLTADSAYDFHRNTDDSPADPLWASYASGNILSGSTYVNGALVNGTVFAMPTSLHNGFNLVEVLTTGNVQADSFNKDRAYHAGNQYHAELIIYDRVLTEAERLSVETYLTDKWMPASPQAKILAFGPGAVVGPVSGNAASISWIVPYGTSVTSLAPSFTMSPGATCDKESGSTNDFTTPVNYIVTSSDNLITNTYTVTVTPPLTTTTVLTSSGSPTTYGNTVTFTATVSPIPSGGTIQFYDAATPLDSPVPVNTGTGVATYSPNVLGAATHAVTAGYSGYGVHVASTSDVLSHVVNKAPLTVRALNAIRAPNTANPDPFSYQIVAGFKNGETLGTSGVTGTPALVTDAVLSSPAGGYTITCALGSLAASNYSFTLVNGVLTVVELENIFSVNFYVGPDWPYGGLTTDEQKANVKLDAGMPAGFGDWYTSGWLNYLVPWGLSAPQAPVTLTSTKGKTATFTLKDCRNGSTYSGGPRTTLLGDGNGNMMDAHVNSTLDGASNKFDMEMTDIPFSVYDVIFYIGANQGQFGDGTGVIVFNGSPERAFKLKPGAFDGTFTEMVDATTPGNYIVYKNVTGSSFTTQTWGTGLNGFNHVGPFGFQIRDATPKGTLISFF